MLNRESSSKTDLKIPDLHGRVDWECSMVAKLEKSRKKIQTVHFRHCQKCTVEM